MARTPLFAALRRHYGLIQAASQPGSAPVDELLAMKREGALTRRQVLRTASAAAAAMALGGSQLIAGQATKTKLGGPRIAIVGGGIAGLNCASHLQASGLPSTIYEASSRTGGRVYTARNLLAPGLTTELGGEFIDSIHKDMLSLAQRFNLPLLDTASKTESQFLASYFFDGRHYSETEVIEAFTPLAKRMAADLATVGNISYLDPGAAYELDHTSVAEYLDQIGARGWIRSLLEVAYVTEYGLDADEQSCLNLLYLIGLKPWQGFEVFGLSDERYKIAGGNQRVVDCLAAEVKDQIVTGHKLVKLAPRGDGYRLSFAVDGKQGSTEVDADLVVLAIPFTLLREVEITVPLPDYKKRAITDLGYGTNAKVFAGTNSRIWRMQGRDGEAFTDELLQLCWDNARLQPGAAGGITFYSGGTPGLDAGKGSAASQVTKLSPGLERIFPGITQTYNGKVARFHWPTYPLTKGSYACYKPGQWGSISGAEIATVGNLYFAGEHCSIDYQGYMNGGAETGRVAAKALGRKVLAGS